MPTLDNLKKEAKRWLKALRSGDETARARLRHLHPDAPAEPTLRDVQLALAREHGFAGWAELKKKVETTGESAGEHAALFLDRACPDWRAGGPAAQITASHAAARLLDRHPEIARHNIYTAVVCGQRDEVERILAERPQAASERGGVKNWEPLLYLCFARLERRPINQKAPEIARLLLDHGADPNADFQIGAAKHTPLVGVIGEGEESRQPHQKADVLVPLLLERGANPCDYQVIYNVTQGQAGTPCRWPELLYEHSVKLGRQSEWNNPNTTGLYDLSPLDWLLTDAVPRNALGCSRWLLERGANPNTRRNWMKTSLHEEALQRGHLDMAALLVQFGALPGGAQLTGEEAFAAGCLRLDRDEAQRALAEHPEYRNSRLALFAAAEQDRPEVIDFVLDLDTPIELEDQHKQRALHVASSNNSLRAAQKLIDRGAEIDPREARWNATPLGVAVYGARREMVGLLSRYSRDIFELVYTGSVERVRAIVRENPELARSTDKNGATLLMYIEDDRRAVDMIELLLSYGADPAVPLKDGTTAADHLRKQGLDEAAHAVEWQGRTPAVSSFLRMACLDWRVGGPDRERQTNAAWRMLQRHPDIARDSIFTAVVCGDLDLVQRTLAQNPDAAAEAGGPRGWPPLLYLCNARLPIPSASEHSVPIARALLNHGADPNTYYSGGDPSIHYTALTCVLGRGEEQGSLHPKARELCALLLERGAEPYDIQVMYNVFAGHASQRHLGEEAIWLMDLIYTHSLARGREADWKDGEWRMLDMGGFGSGARYLLTQAIGANHLRLAEWVLAHGANPDPPPSGKSKGSVYEEAVRRGRMEIAALLIRYGATAELSEGDDEAAFVEACMQLDRARVERLLAAHPEYRRLATPMLKAAEVDRVDVIRMLLDLGVPPDVEQSQSRERALHNAAYHDSPLVAKLLIERGADLDFMENAWEASPLGAAQWGQKQRMAAMLAPLSRDVWSLVSGGWVERLREVLAAEPRLARVTWENQSPLFWLPDDENTAAQIVALFLAHGTDSTLRNNEGETAADRAEQRGLDQAARLLRD